MNGESNAPYNPTADESKIWKKLVKPLLKLAALAVVVSPLTRLVTVPVYDSYWPKNMHGVKSSEKTLNKIVNTTLRISSYPAENLFNLISWNRYEEIRDATLDAYNIDENAIDLDFIDERAALYRKMGYAVLTEDFKDNRIYIPAKAWIKAFEEKKGFTPPGWDKWKEPLTTRKQTRGMILGKAYYLMDSEKQKGNGDGIVSLWEYTLAMRMIGFKDIPHVVELKYIKEYAAKVKN